MNFFLRHTVPRRQTRRDAFSAPPPPPPPLSLNSRFPDRDPGRPGPVPVRPPGQGGRVRFLEGRPRREQGGSTRTRRPAGGGRRGLPGGLARRQAQDVAQRRPIIELEKTRTQNQFFFPFLAPCLPMSKTFSSILIKKKFLFQRRYHLRPPSFSSQLRFPFLGCDLCACLPCSLSLLFLY